MTEVTPNDLMVMLTEIKGDVKATHDAVSRHLKEDDRIHADHEKRLRVNEKFRWGATAIMVVISALGTWGIFA